MAEYVDLQEQTAADYSVVVDAPRGNYLDIEEWRSYFSAFGHVTYVTVGLNNGKLLQLLAEKRSALLQLHKEDDAKGPTSMAEVRAKVAASARANLHFYRPVNDGDDGDDEEKVHGKTSSARANDEWSKEDESNLNEVVASLSSTMASKEWRDKMRAKAEAEAAVRGFQGHMVLLIQKMGYFRDSAYYRHAIVSLESQIQALIEKGQPQAAKVCVIPPKLKLRSASLTNLLRSAGVYCV